MWPNDVLSDTSWRAAKHRHRPASARELPDRSRCVRAMFCPRRSASLSPPSVCTCGLQAGEWRAVQILKRVGRYRLGSSMPLAALACLSLTSVCTCRVGGWRCLSEMCSKSTCALCRLAHTRTLARSNPPTQHAHPRARAHTHTKEHIPGPMKLKARLSNVRSCHLLVCPRPPARVCVRVCTQIRCSFVSEQEKGEKREGGREGGSEDGTLAVAQLLHMTPACCGCSPTKH